MRRHAYDQDRGDARSISSSEDKIQGLFEAGVEWPAEFQSRSQDDHRQSIAAIRSRKATKRPIAIMMDLQGPKLRVGDFSEGGRFWSWAAVRFDMDSAPRADRVSLPHKEIFAALEPGSDLLGTMGRSGSR